jgi:Na+/proline symporter
MKYIWLFTGTIGLLYCTTELYFGNYPYNTLIITLLSFILSHLWSLSEKIDSLYKIVKIKTQSSEEEFREIIKRI